MIDNVVALTDTQSQYYRHHRSVVRLVGTNRVMRRSTHGGGQRQIVCCAGRRRSVLFQLNSLSGRCDVVVSFALTAVEIDQY
jgi:hypothetical protein